MSVPRGFELIELRPEEWFAIVAHNESDFDFSGGYNTYGPFPDSDAAFHAAMERESNPGSVETIRFPEVSDRERKLLSFE